jgi:RNA polymerase sigma factor (sigma-70 family)
MQNYPHLSIEDLIWRCYALGELEAWEEFVRRFHRLIATVVIRAAGRMGNTSKQTIDDLIQETYLRFCADNYRVLRNFEHRHPEAFLGFIKVVASNVVRDHFKSTYSEKHGANRIEGLSEELPPASVDGSYGSPKALERAVLIGEVERHLAICVTGVDEERNRRIFWLYYRAGLSAGAIAALPEMGLTTKGVESLILRMTKELRRRMTSENPETSKTDPRAAEGILPAESF